MQNESVSNKRCTLCNVLFRNERGMFNHNRWKHPEKSNTPLTKEKRERFRRLMSDRFDDKNPHYRPSTKNYNTLHGYMHRRKIKPTHCGSCGKKKKMLDMAFKDHSVRQKDEKYTRNPEDWVFLCRSCHMKADGRMKNLKQYRGGED